ncbi:MAG: DUF99 family protein [archaeon]
MKKEIRIIGIDDAPFDKFRDKTTLLVGVVYRGGSFLDGVVSTRVGVDGNNATDKIASMVSGCRFRPQLQAIILDGIAVGGFNVVDIKQVYDRTGIPVIVVMRAYPDLEKIECALKKLGKGKKLRYIRNAGPIYRAGKIHIQFCGIEPERATGIIKLTSTHSLIPEPIRAAHLIASGVVSGESRGRA